VDPGGNRFKSSELPLVSFLHRPKNKCSGIGDVPGICIDTKSGMMGPLNVTYNKFIK
jgi:hypothetical protein